VENKLDEESFVVVEEIEVEAESFEEPRNKLVGFVLSVKEGEGVENKVEEESFAGVDEKLIGVSFDFGVLSTLSPLPPSSSSSPSP